MRRSYSPSTTLCSKVLDLNTFEHQTISAPSGKHIKLVGRYWLIFKMETQTAPYQSGISFRTIRACHIEETEKGSEILSLQIPSKGVKLGNNILNNTKVYILIDLELEWEPKTQIWGEFCGTCFAHIRTKRGQYVFAYIE